MELKVLPIYGGSDDGWDVDPVAMLCDVGRTKAPIAEAHAILEAHPNVASVSFYWGMTDDEKLLVEADDEVLIEAEVALAGMQEPALVAFSEATENEIPWRCSSLEVWLTGAQLNFYSEYSDESFVVYLPKE